MKAPDTAPTGAIPQPGLGPVWPLVATEPEAAEPEVAPVPAAPLAPLALALPVEPALPSPLLTPPLVEPGAAVFPLLAPEATSLEPDPILPVAAPAPLPVDSLPIPASPLLAPLPVEEEPEAPWVPLPPHATATRSATQGIAREQYR